MRTHTSTAQTDVASVAFGIAAAAGLLHAVASLYWAVGGRWQLESVGEWAVELARESPVEIGLALGLIALVKAVAAVVPMVNERRKSRFYRPIRWCGWSGGVVLVVWGGVSSLSACAGARRPRLAQQWIQPDHHDRARLHMGSAVCSVGCRAPDGPMAHQARTTSGAPRPLSAINGGWRTGNRLPPAPLAIPLPTVRYHRTCISGFLAEIDPETGYMSEAPSDSP